MEPCNAMKDGETVFRKVFRTQYEEIVLTGTHRRACMTVTEIETGDTYVASFYSGISGAEKEVEELFSPKVVSEWVEFK